MDIHFIEFGMKSRKFVMCASCLCYRSVCRHPFLAGFLCFLLCLYRSFPLIFSLLVSASPVLVCTAVLLGTLLSFGQPNIPEIEEEKTTAYEAVLIRTGVALATDDAVVVAEKSEGCLVESFSYGVGMVVSKVGGVPGVVVSEDTIPLIGERERSREVELKHEKTKLDDDGMCSDDGRDNSQEIKCWESKAVEKTNWDEERQSDGEVVENHYSPIPAVDDGRSSSDDEKTEGSDSFGSEKVNVDTLDSPPKSPWTQVATRKEEVARTRDVGDDDEEDEDMDSGSDRAESSSPDASMTDIIPMLDELHTLLDEGLSRPDHFFLDGSDAGSQISQESESDNETKKHKYDDDDDDDDEDEQDEHGEKEEAIKSAITWTEEDQKNLMDLGSSEIERNIRLENLILRRRARRNINLLPERDLIDLESLDFPFSVAPISTVRHNPFDHLNDSHDNLGLPPIPGSAPSVLLRRRNPFDIPYDSSEERPNLSGAGFREKCAVPRHGSFNGRPSVFSQDGNDVRMITEESSYSLFQRQLSGISESKVSSVMETESVYSVENINEGKFSEDANLAKIADIQLMTAGSKEGSSSGNPKQVFSVHQDRELTSIIESISQDVNESSEGLERCSGLGRAENSEVGDDELKFQAELPEVEAAHATTYDPNSDNIGQRYRSRSSSSSLSEESERVFTEMDSEEFLHLERRNTYVSDELEITTHSSVQRTEQSIINASVVNNNVAHHEPVYGSSSVSTEVLPSASNPDSPVKGTVSITERESELTISEIESSILSDTSDKASTNANTAEERNSYEVSSTCPSTGHIHSTQDLPQEVIKYSENVVESLATDAYVTHEAVENLISFLDDENMPTIHRQAILEPSLEDPHQMQESCVPFSLSVDDLTMKDFSSVGIQELEFSSSSNTEGPLIPDFSSSGSIVFETVEPHSDLQTMVGEEVDVIKEIDEALLSELDNVGDFSIGQWGEGSSKLETNEESTGESSNSSQHLEMSKSRVDEVNSVEDILHSEILSRDVLVDLSEIDAKECNVQDLLDEEASTIVLEETEVEIQVIEDSYPVKNEITCHAEILNQLSQADSTMLELDGSTTEDIDAEFKMINTNEIDKPVKQPQIDDELLNDQLPDSVDQVVQMVESGDKIETNAETIPLDCDKVQHHTGKSDELFEEVKESDKGGPSEEGLSANDVKAPGGIGEVEASKDKNEIEEAKEFGEVIKETAKGLGEVGTKEFGEIEVPKDLDSSKGVEEKGKEYKISSSS